MGLIEEGETPEEAAAREVMEATGWRPGPIKPPIYAQSANGITDSQHHVFHVAGVT
jgi:8-oxo-dGTP pyrophosphatase MutT (NUDIX family)